MKNIISASRRTDLVMSKSNYNWLLESFNKGYAEVQNPKFPENISRVDLSCDKVGVVVLWSKNLSNFRDNPGVLSNYNIYFQNTITGYKKGILESAAVPSLDEDIKILKDLKDMGYKPEQFNIRFDPIIITNQELSPTPDKPWKARLYVFQELLEKLEGIGFHDCRITTSYVSLYGKIEERIINADIGYFPLDIRAQNIFVIKMAKIAKEYNKDIYTCADNNLLLYGADNLKQSHCIDGVYLSELFGEKYSLRHDSGQREECGCTISKDIGAYRVGYTCNRNGMLIEYKGQPCPGDCLYCYAIK